MHYRALVVSLAALAIVGVSTVAVPAAAHADTGLPVSTDVTAVIAEPDAGWPAGISSDPDGTLVLAPGIAVEIPVFLVNASTANDYLVDASSPGQCAGHYVPRAPNSLRSYYLACSVEFTGQAGEHGDLSYTFTETNGTAGTDVQTTLAPVPYRVADDRPVVSVSHGGVAVPDGTTISVPTGSSPQLDASVASATDGDIESPASFVSPSPSSCISVPAVDIDPSHSLDCVATVGPAVQDPTPITFAASDDSSYRTGVIGRASVSYRGSGSCSTNETTVTAGDTLTVSCTGFAPGLKLTAAQHSAPTTVAADIAVPDSGAFAFSYTVPSATGKHTVSILLDGTVLYTTAAFSVSVPGLALTGVSVGWQTWALIGALLLAGLSLVVLGRRSIRRAR
jgi:hypothetical protein